MGECKGSVEELPRTGESDVSGDTVIHFTCGSGMDARRISVSASERPQAAAASGSRAGAEGRIQLQAAD